MDSPPLSLQVLATLQARHAFVEDLGRKLHELGLPALVFHEHFHGAAMAQRTHLAEYIQRLCRTWGVNFVSSVARSGLSEYSVHPEGLFVLRGKGTRSRPYVVVAPAFALLVHQVVDGDGRHRYQVPLHARKGEARLVSGPAPYPQDLHFNSHQPVYAESVERFMGGVLGAGPEGTPFEIDTAAEYFTARPGLRYDLLGVTPHDPHPDSRVIWAFAQRSTYDPKHTVEWSLELPRPAEQELESEEEEDGEERASRERRTREPMVSWRILFDQRLVKEMARVKADVDEAVRRRHPHEPLGRAPL